MTKEQTTAGDTARSTQASREDLVRFIDRYGDLIDDRVAEIVEEVVDEVVAARSARQRGLSWLRLSVFTAALMGVSVLLRDSPFAVAAMWMAGAVMCVCGSVSSWHGHTAHRSSGRPARMP